jgi:hypothetical protein
LEYNVSFLTTFLNVSGTVLALYSKAISAEERPSRYAHTADESHHHGSLRDMKTLFHYDIGLRTPNCPALAWPL